LEAPRLSQRPWWLATPLEPPLELPLEPQPQPHPQRRAVLRAGVAASGALLAGGLSGCGRADDDSTGVLTVAVFPLLDEIVKTALPLWRQRHPDVALRLVIRQHGDHHTAMTTALSTAVGLPDVLALESGFVGRFTQGGGLEDLTQPPYGIGHFRDRYVPYAYDQAMLRSGAVMAAPADIAPAAMLYRHDLVTRAGVDPAELTGSWDSYVQAGLRIRAATGAHLVSHVQTLKDMAIRTGIRPGDGLYFDAESRPLVTEPRFHRAFELALRVRQEGLDARVGAWTNEWTEGLRRGTLATEMSGAWLVGQLSQTAAPKTAGLWRAAQLPNGLFAPYGGAFYALPRRAAPARRALAWDFVQLMTLTAEVQASAFRRFDAFPALRATHQDDFFNEPLPFLGGQRARLLWREAAGRIQATPVHKQNSFADEVVATELDQVLDRGKSIAQALGDAQRLLQRRAKR